MIQFQQFHPRFSTNRRLRGCGLPTSNSCLIVIGNRQWQWPNWYKIIVLILNIARDPLSIQIKHHVRYLWCKNYRHWQSQIILLHIFIPRFHSLAIRISPHILSIPKITLEPQQLPWSQFSSAWEKSQVSCNQLLICFQLFTMTVSLYETVWGQLDNQFVDFCTATLTNYNYPQLNSQKSLVGFVGHFNAIL